MKRLRNRGAAVILAMLVAALAATVAMAIAAGQQRWFADVAARRDQVQAQSLALAGVQWTRQILNDDARRGAIDFPGEPWAYPLPPTPLENGTIEGRIVDAQGLLNVNNLVLATTRQEQETARFAALFARLRIPAATVDALGDFVDADGRERPGGAEDAWYARQGGYLPANAPLTRTGELAAVRGFDEATLPRVLPYVAALPADTKLNVNTAPPAVLAAAVQGLYDAAADALAAERVRRPFTTIADFRSRLPEGTVLGNENGYTVESNWFLVTVRARQGAAVAQARALVHRAAGAWPDVAWQTLE